jgi:hypothetical protein
MDEDKPGLNVIRATDGTIYIISLASVVKAYKLVPSSIADDSSLFISLKTNSNDELAYAGTDSMVDSYQPADGRVPQTGKVNYIRPKIRTTSPVEIASCDLAAIK